MALYNEVLPEFHKAGADLIGISVDGGVSRRVFGLAEAAIPAARGFRNRGRGLARVRCDTRHDGTSERALFVIRRRRRHSLELLRAGRCETRVQTAFWRRSTSCMADVVSRSDWPSHGRIAPGSRRRDHSIGPIEAPVTLVQYGDFQCPIGARAHPIVTAVRNNSVRSLRFVFATSQ